MKTKITILNGGKEFNYYSDKDVFEILNDINDYGFIDLSDKEVLIVPKNQLMKLKREE